MSNKGATGGRKGTIHVVERMSHGSIETLAADLANQLPGDNLIFSLYGSRNRIIHDWPQFEPFKDQIYGFSKTQGISPSLFFKLRKQFQKLKPHAVITHHMDPFIYGGMAARFAKVPVIAHVEHDVWHFNSRRDKMLTKAVYSFVRPKIVGVSMKAADTLATITGCKKVDFINSGVDLKRFRPSDKKGVRQRWDIPVDSLVIGCVGRLEKVKGYDVLLDAMTGLPEGVTCVFVGGGSQMELLKEKVEELHLVEQVRFIGNVDDPSQIYPAFDVFCQPSRIEGLPLSVLEAQACGVPVVATDVGSVRDAVCPDIGRVVDSEDSENLAIALLELLRDRELPSPRSFIAENFSWGDTLSAYSKLIRA